LRSRGASLRPFDLVEDMQRTAEARFRQTEQQLTAHLDETQKKLTELRTGRGSANATAVISEQQREAIDALRRDIIDTRGRLRTVQLELRRDIRSLETELRLFNIVLVPAVLTVLALVLGVARRQRRARART
jgi:chromosome segregation ATPase